LICKQEIFSATQQLGYNEVAVQANLQVMPELKSGFLEVSQNKNAPQGRLIPIPDQTCIIAGRAMPAE